MELSFSWRLYLTTGSQKALESWQWVPGSWCQPAPAHHRLGKLKWHVTQEWLSSDQNPGCSAHIEAIWKDSHGKIWGVTFELGCSTVAEGHTGSHVPGNCWLTLADTGTWRVPRLHWALTSSVLSLQPRQWHTWSLAASAVEGDSKALFLAVLQQFSCLPLFGPQPLVPEGICMWMGLKSPRGQVGSLNHSQAHKGRNPSWPAFPASVPDSPPRPTSNPARLRGWDGGHCQLPTCRTPASQAPNNSSPAGSFFSLFMLPGDHALFWPEPSIQMGNPCHSSGHLGLQGLGRELCLRPPERYCCQHVPVHSTFLGVPHCRCLPWPANK